MAERRIQDSLKRLFTRGLILRRFDSIPHNAGNYYQISQTGEDRKTIGRILGVEAEALLQPHFRSQELIHSELCAVWWTRFRQLLLDAEVMRDFRMVKDAGAKRVLLARHDNLRLLPDLLLRMPRGSGAGQAHIAVEVENTRKTYDRLTTKLKKLTTRTLLDGVIFICSKRTILENLTRLYVEGVRDRALRIKHYGANFLLFAEIDASMSKDELKLYNCNSQPVILQHWMHSIIHTDLRRRRDSQFTPSA